MHPFFSQKRHTIAEFVSGLKPKQSMSRKKAMAVEFNTHVHAPHETRDLYPAQASVQRRAVC